MANQSLDYELLKQLTQAFRPSGNERETADLISRQVGTYAGSVLRDLLGNLIIRKPGTGKKIMMVCHMDEVGVIITHIDEKGYLILLFGGRIET
jgi:endoglucanase